MSGKKLKEEIRLGGYAAQLLNYGNSFRAFPIETMDVTALNKEEVNV